MGPATMVARDSRSTRTAQLRAPPPASSKMTAMTYDDATLTARPLVNLRDLGGISVEGGRLRPAALWRADDLTMSPREEIAALAEQGLSAVLDLRSTPEVTRSPHRMAGELGVTAHHLPLAEMAVHPLALIEVAPSMQSPADVGRWYAGLVRSHIHEVAEGLEVIGNSTGGVLFHCAAGKDRTGILAAVVLQLLGADRSVIVEDYARTEQNLTAIFDRLAHAAYSRPDHESEDAKRTAEFFASKHPLLSAPADSMDSMLTELGGASGLAELLRRETDPDLLAENLHTKLVA
ncbi:tyrosine-protein phosphatase [Nesterenkonia sp. Hz 6-5]|nr:tyrosine-protein phosphatase [Nesterenkonia haasae]